MPPACTWNDLLRKAQLIEANRDVLECRVKLVASRIVEIRLMSCWLMCRAQYDFAWAQLWYPSIAGLATCTGVSDLVIPWREGQACAP